MAADAGPEAKAELLEAIDEPGLATVAVAVGAAATAHEVTIATAESCTGGLIGHALTEVAGSSTYYRGGVISYSDDVKVDLLGVPRTALEQHGAVSAQVALAMAQGVRARLGADFGVAVTGIAGPSGGTPSKPVGLTYVAVAGPTTDDVQRYVWEGDRSANKRLSAHAALKRLSELVGTTDSAAGTR